MSCRFQMNTAGVAYKKGCRCERCRTHNASENKRRQAQKNAWDRAHRPLCACGKPMRRGANRCLACVRESELADRGLLEQLWADGLKGRQIGEIMGWTCQPNSQIGKRREEGWNLPYRKDDGPIVKANQAKALAKNRAMRFV